MTDCVDFHEYEVPSSPLRDWYTLGLYDGKWGLTPHNPERFPDAESESAYMGAYREAEKTHRGAAKAVYRETIKEAAQLRRRLRGRRRWGAPW